MVVRPVGYNESTLVRIHSQCGCSCGAAERCYDDQRRDQQDPAACSGLQGGTAAGEGAGCRAQGSEVDCSGRGVCECGRCVCEQSRLGAVYGKHCEVDDFSCPYEGGRLCAGEEEEEEEELLHHFISFLFFPQLCVASCALCVFVSQAEVCACPASVCVTTAGVETAADAPPPPPAAYQPTAPSAVGGAAASVAGACATTRCSTETSVSDVPPARAAVNQTGTSSRLHLHLAVVVLLLS